MMFVRSIMLHHFIYLVVRQMAKLSVLKVILTFCMKLILIFLKIMPMNSMTTLIIYLIWK